ncbi:MAG: DNA-directed RNA polymerase subunit alpha [bacterium]|nr:DNA-directed RNA polymerase subunit alpha [bacterium]
MEQFILPSTFRWEAGEAPNTATVAIEPCYFGYGTTLGNALRRVLLSSLEGAAVTAVKIDGAPHEFAAISDVQEDVIEILMNLKQLRLKIFSDEPVRLILEASGKGAVRAEQIAKQSDVEIVNPDLVLATLTSDRAKLRMEIFAERGRGYITTDNRGKERRELGTIAIDSIFSPVRNVGFQVENTRVGEITNYDRLLFTVETDGTMSPEEVVRQGAKILIDHFALIVQPPVAGDEVMGAAVGAESLVDDVSDSSTADREETS